MTDLRRVFEVAPYQASRAGRDFEDTTQAREGGRPALAEPWPDPAGGARQ